MVSFNSEIAGENPLWIPEMSPRDETTKAGHPPA